MNGYLLFWCEIIGVNSIVNPFDFTIMYYCKPFKFCIHLVLLTTDYWTKNEYYFEYMSKTMQDYLIAIKYYFNGDK